MADKEAIIGIGIWRRKDNILGEMIEVCPMKWDEREGRPIGVGSTYDHPHLDSLYFDGRISDYMSGESVNEPDWPYFHGADAEYRNVYSVDWRRAKVMADFLAKVQREMEKAHAREQGDRFMVFAKCMKASRVWLAKGPDHKMETWPRKTEWIQYSVVEGRDLYRLMIREARADMRERLLPKAREVA
jgi:hypothetical protein